METIPTNNLSPIKNNLDIKPKPIKKEQKRPHLSSSPPFYRYKTAPFLYHLFLMVCPCHSQKSFRDNTLITSQPISLNFHSQNQNNFSEYYSSKRKKAESEQRSITNILGGLKTEPSPQKQLNYIAKTFQRNRTYTSIPSSSIQNNQTKRRDIKKEKVHPFYRFVAKRNKSTHSPNQEIIKHSSFFNSERIRVTEKVNQTTHIRFTHNNSTNHKGRTLNNSQLTKQSQKPLGRSTTIRNSNQQERPFKWTRMGDKRIFKLKTTAI